MIDLIKAIVILILGFVGVSWGLFLLVTVSVLTVQLLRECWKYATNNK